MAASVSSLDKDLRKLRLEKYTPAAANEARSWIEGILGERLPGGDLLEGLRDGVALCKLVNLAVGPPGVKFKKSAMPFVQMENVSHFLRACQSPPLNLQQHDMFLTVDLYEQKDPAQVLQCLGAFSRAANNVNPSAFPTSIGPRTGRGTVLSPQSTGPSTPTGLSAGLRGRGTSNASNASSSVYGNRPALVGSKTGDSGSGRMSPTKSPTQNGSGSPVNVSSWSKREHEGATSPAWNIAQYGYMGGASQGNLGIVYGGRRQITSAGPYVPNAAEKEKRRKEEAERQRQQAEEEERRRQAEIEAEEERARLEEERRWEEETRRLKEEAARQAEEEKRRWEEEERQWRLTEEKRRQEEEAAEARLREERQRARSKSDARLRGQFLSQYKAEHEAKESEESGYSSRIKALEKELELARKREAEYERERQGRSRRQGGDDEVEVEDKKARTRSRSRPAERPVSRQDSWRAHDDERAFLASQWSQQQQQQQDQRDESPPPPPIRSPRPLPDPATAAPPPQPQKLKKQRTGGDGPPAIPVRKHHTGSRPLPDPNAYAAQPPSQSSTSPQQQRQLPQPQQYQEQTAPLQTRQLPQPQPSTTSPQQVRQLPQQPQPSQPSTSTQQQRQLPQPQQHSPQQQKQQPHLPEKPSNRYPFAAKPTPPLTQTTPVAAQKPTHTPIKTSGGSWASKSLLEREMEMERQRQREWEEAQKETAAKAATISSEAGVDGIGGGVGGRWDVSQWAGYTGGDSQNKGAQGIGAGRRQIVGPRPLPGAPGR
ncbi:Transgelin [Diplogelasinospora grovesii]|uniref:Transgelin n=1 Tax=Diplogelasinospora grovesii TaxID=303347 RepID=A0AAN6S296_9PEZI|nr:Transgelin [Diplogelasinospora grovesii]